MPKGFTQWAWWLFRTPRGVKWACIPCQCDPVPSCRRVSWQKQLFTSMPCKSHHKTQPRLPIQARPNNPVLFSSPTKQSHKTVPQAPLPIDWPTQTTKGPQNYSQWVSKRCPMTSQWCHTMSPQKLDTNIRHPNMSPKENDDVSRK